MSDKHEDPLIGKILFKHYKLKKKIGEGSFGRIYVGVNIDTKEEYAIKLVRKKKNIIFPKNKFIINVGAKRYNKKFIRNGGLYFATFKSIWNSRNSTLWIQFNF